MPVRPVKVRSLPIAPKTISGAISSTRAAITAQVTAPHTASTARAGLRRAIQTKATAASASIAVTSDVFDVDIRIIARPKPTHPIHQIARLGASTAEAAENTTRKVIISPSAFFSCQRPRQAPGKISLITPHSGRTTATAALVTPMITKAVAKISARVDQRHWAASPTPARLVKTMATARRSVISGAIDHSVDSTQRPSSNSSAGDRSRAPKPRRFASMMTDRP